LAPGHLPTPARNCACPGSAPSTPPSQPAAPTPKPPPPRKADDRDRARRHETLAASYRALQHHFQQREQTLAQVMTDRQAWEHATADTRHLAIAADAELRRRHPGRKIEPLRSAEPAPASGTQREHPHPAPGRQPAQTAPDPGPRPAAPGIPRRNRRICAADGAWWRPDMGRPR